MATPLNLTGTPSDDVLIGGRGNDVLEGRGGDDVLFGRGGADLLRGGNGNDTLIGDGGRDTLVGGRGDDLLFGGAGRDTAVFSDAIGNYGFEVLPDGRVVVTGLSGNAVADGSDTLLDIEVLRFADETILASNVPCFTAGTRIETPRGEVPVEDLRPGDEVVLAAGGTARIAWLGSTTLDIARHRWPDLVRPVRIRAGALADGVPRRDLLLSPEHALALDGVLVPAKLLVNGRAILAEPGVARVTYLHVELPTHAALLAEGAPAESYLDLGHRHLLQAVGDGAPPAAQHPPVACAPRIEAGPRLEALRARLAARADSFAGLAETTDSDLHIVAEDTVLRAASGTRFTLPVGTREVRIVSRAACPAATQPDGDRRMLGVALTGIRLRGANGRWMDVSVTDPALAIGFHPAEGTPDQPHRWTDGTALLPGRFLAPFADTEVTLELKVLAAQPSWVMARAA
jgi:hypothetical protein